MRHPPPSAPRMAPASRLDLRILPSRPTDIRRSAAAVARGTVSLVRKPCNRPNCRLCRSGEKHPALIFTCRVDGKGRCFHVQPKHEAIMRRAVENGRRLEALMAKAGVDLVKSLREAAG